MQNIYEKTIRIRCFEEHILDLFSKNMLSGTTHTYIGEEATAVAVMSHVKEDDVVFSNHRCHGHYLAYGGSERALLAEIMSKSSGLCQGRGGSQHIHYKNFFTNGIQGGIVPNAVGVALAKKLQNKDSNAIVFLGDGTLGQGIVYESMNMAAIYDIPVVFIIEDNSYAMSTRREDAVAGDIKKRIEGFDITAFDIESTDVDELDEFFKLVFSYVNKNRKPVCAVVHNYRLGAHSKGDDTRDPAEIEAHRKYDPIKIIRDRIGIEEVDRLKDQYKKELSSLTQDLLTEDSIIIDLSDESESASHENTSLLETEAMRCVEEIRDAFADALKRDDRVILIGEDIRDPYGGAFKATKGLSDLKSSHVMNTPISEACIVGMSVGLAMAGMTPVSEMMFGDFITLGFDQLLNHAVKYSWVYGGDVKVPMVIRVPSGAGRGYGPTHSQSLEKYLVGIPGLNVLALNRYINAKSFYDRLFSTISEPTVVIENKKMYAQRTIPVAEGTYRDFEVTEENSADFPTIYFKMDSSNTPDVALVAYGREIDLALQAAEELMIADEIQADVIALTRISPVPIDDLKNLISKSAYIITVEEGTIQNGIGAEIIALCAENKLGRNHYRIAAPNIPIPNGIVLEDQIMPNTSTITELVRRICNGK